MRKAGPRLFSGIIEKERGRISLIRSDPLGVSPVSRNERGGGIQVRNGPEGSVPRLKERGSLVVKLRLMVAGQKRLEMLVLGRSSETHRVRFHPLDAAGNLASRRMCWISTPSQSRLPRIPTRKSRLSTNIAMTAKECITLNTDSE